MSKSNKGSLIAIVVVILLVLWAVVAGISFNNKAVQQEEGVRQAWSQVENQYQRRADLIPNLVNTVKGYATHERETLEGVVEARAKATQMTVDPTKMTPEDLAAYQQAQGELSQALGRLLAVSERYPDLKANENFKALQVQLEGTENRISTERKRFNEVTQEYNTFVRKFPNNIFGSILGFKAKPYFESVAGADRAPEVKF
ncbi:MULTISPECIES: LemA family protein [Porphyromonas]|uniref:LemA family protein n=1 Tax=Porphyromonas TaxID=836 RepID=UPI0003818003|nr:MULTISPECIES: LemA family protein [Porphyromonas]MDD7468003.1 LemA family protein [Bacteroidales bacterium]MDY6101510.1 LemA family protein [Porphyromonas sp.]